MAHHWLAALGVFFAVECATAEVLPGHKWPDPVSDFLTDKGKTAKDISGIACAPGNNGLRICLVINDEDRSAQIATIQGEVLSPGKRIELISPTNTADILGAQPVARDAKCSGGVGKFKDLDGEAVALDPDTTAYDGNYAFYVIGSHGCTRNSRLFNVSAFITVRVIIDKLGNVVSVKNKNSLATFRFADAIRNEPELAKSFAADLMTDAPGVNVEGLAVFNGYLLAGLRAPANDKTPNIVAAKISELFAPGPTPFPPLPAGGSRLMKVTGIESGGGIRDMALLASDGGGQRLLVLSGPITAGSEPYVISISDPIAKDFPFATMKVRELGTVVPAADGKAEALHVLEATEKFVKVLLLFDGIKNGAPREYQISLQ